MNKQVVSWVLCAGLVAGCSSKVEEAARERAAAREAATRAEPETVEIYDRMNELLAEGETNGAIALLEASLDDPAAEGQRPWVFQNLIELMLQSGRLEEARKAVLAAFRAQEAHAQNVFGLLYRHYVNAGDEAGRLSWTAALVDAGLSGRMKLHAYAWRLATLYEAGGIDDALGFLPDCIEALSEQNARLAVSSFLDRVLAADDTAAVERVLARTEELAEDDAGLQSLVAAVRIRVLTSRSEWDQADALLRSAASAMQDKDLARALRMLGQQAREAGRAALGESLAEFVLEETGDKPRAREVAASMWVAAGREAGPESVVERLEAIMEAGISNTAMVRVYRSGFYDVVNSKNNALVERLVKLGDRVLARLEPTDDTRGIRMLQLDASFIMADYERAIRLLEEGVPGRDEAWHEMALNKVKAHQALEEGRPEEAIERFRVFMEGVKEWEDPERDPATGVVHTKEMTLGRNALRLAGIYASMGKEAEAARVFGEAADYYTRALASVEPNSKEAALIRKEMQEIPALK